MRLLKPLRSDLWWPPDILRLQVLIQKVLLFALSLLAARSTLLSWTVEVSDNIFAPLSGWTTHIGVRKMLRNFKFPISNYFVLVLACMALLQAVAGQINPDDQMVWYGGPGQALAFYGTRTGLLLPIGLSNDEVDEVFTLEFWVQARCAHITCTFFTLQNLYNQEFAYTHRDSMHCFGQRFSLVDGHIPGLSGPVDWSLYKYSPEWHHFAFIANATTGTCRIFIDANLLVEAQSNQWLSSLPANPSEVKRPPFFSIYARLVFGQLVIGHAYPPPKYSFQGFVDEIRLWSVDRTQNLAQTMFRGDYMSNPLMRGYWNMDTELPQVMAPDPPPPATPSWKPAEMSVKDVAYYRQGSPLDGVFQQVDAFALNVRGPYGPSTITFAPSTAPIVTQNYPWLIHVNSSLEAMNPFELRYVCFVEAGPVPCDPTLVSPIYLPYDGQFPTGSFPKAGQLFSFTANEDPKPLLSGQNKTTSRNWGYQPFPFLISGQFDGFHWRLGDTYEGGFVSVYGAPLTTYSPYNLSITGNLAGTIFNVSGTDPTPIYLACGSYLGDEAQAAVVTSPLQGQLYQAQVRPSSANGSLEFYPTRQITQCRDPSLPDKDCLVSHYSNVVFYQPIEDHEHPSIDFSLSFVCISPRLEGTSKLQRVLIRVINQPKDYSDVTYSRSLVGPNPFALSFDGSLSRLRAYTPDASPVKAVSLWVKPAINLQFEPLTSTFIEKQTLIQMFPSNATTDRYFALTLVRNASSYPDYFVEIENYDTSISAFRTLVAFNNTRTGFISPNEWTNIVLTYYPGQDVLMGLYFDGSPIATVSLGTILTPVSMYVGGSQDTRAYRGEMDEVSLWKSPLGAFDVLNLQSENLLPTNDNLLALWSFNEGNGYKTTDSVMNWKLIPTPLAPSSMPLWVPADSAISFSSIQTSISSPQVLTLPIHSASDDGTWRFATYLTQLPANGALYHYSYWNGTTSKRGATIDPSTLVRISSTFNPSSSFLPEQVQLWASGVQNYSSSREPPIGTTYWAAQHILGPPSWWKQDGSAAPVYGDSTQSWCPNPDCLTNVPPTEWIEVTFMEYLYLTSVEVFQNLAPGSITKISAWDERNSRWRAVYEGEAKRSGTDYATFAPLFCAISSFVTRAIRIEMQPCSSPSYGWRQIEAVRISGLRTLPVGVVSDRVVYVPDPKKPGTDVITYTASQCPLTPRSISPSFSYSLKLAAGTVVAPTATSGTVDVKARGLTLLQLPAYSPDSSITHFQRIISRFPAKGVLYDAEVSGNGAMKPSHRLSAPGPTLVSNPDGFIFYYGPSKCKYNLTSFEYYVSAQGQISGPATITINSLCQASYLNYSRWLGILLLILTIVAIACAILFGIFTFLKRKKKSFEEDRPLLLLIIAAGVIIAYASLFFEFAPHRVGYCLARMWVLHLGCITVVAGSLAFTLLVWNDFSLQSLRSNSNKKVVTSAIVLPVLAVLIELALLIVFSAVNTPIISRSVSPSNGAISVTTCEDRHFSSSLILLNMAAWVFAIFIISSIILSVSLTAVRSAVVMLASSLLGLICGIVFVTALLSVKDPDVQLLLRVISLVIPFSALLSLLLVGKFSSLMKPNTVETTEFGLQPISSAPKSSSRPKVGQHETAANVKMTRGMNNHSVDKSVNALLDTVQDKEREIALLKRKLLKRHYRIRELQQKLSDTVEGSQMMYSQAPPSDYGDDYAD